MKISKKDLIEHEVEVDMPVWKGNMRITPKTICFDKETNKFVLKIISTGEIDYSFDNLEDLVRMTNKIYDYDDEVVE